MMYSVGVVMMRVRLFPDVVCSDVKRALFNVMDHSDPNIEVVLDPDIESVHWSLLVPVDTGLGGDDTIPHTIP